MGRVINAKPWRAVQLGKRPGTHWIWGWVDTRTGLDGWKKSRPHWIRSSDRPACLCLCALRKDFCVCKHNMKKPERNTVASK